MNRVIQTPHFHDWGNLLLALVMLWSYFAFSQYLIIWSANLPEETTWYVARTHGAWGVIAIAIDPPVCVSVYDALVTRGENELRETGVAGGADSDNEICGCESG
jgi:hypothetical protein